MVNEKLFLWEFLISKIKFDPGVTPVPDYVNIKIVLRCSNILSIEINPGECPVENPESTNFKADNGEYNLKIGKTCLFAGKEDEISNILKSTPLTTELLLSKKSAATASFKWPSEITDIHSAIHTATLDFIDASNKKVASMNLSMKLMPLGDNVDSYFSLKNKEATFMNPKTKAKFKCDKTVTIEFPPADLPMANDSKISWIGIYERKAAPDALSVVQPFHMDDDNLEEKFNKAETASRNSGWDAISIKCRPAENRFMDFLNLMAEEAQGRGSAPSFRKTKFSDKVGVHKYAHDELENELTSDKVMRRCCTNPACPAAQKFKEYGLGPLATGPGLGTMYKKVQPTKTYRLSNTYGVFTRYGPFGIFAKSEYPFYPPKEDTTEACPSDFPCLPDEDQTEVCSCPDTDTSAKTSSCTCGVKHCRLRGGAEKIENKREKQQDKETPLRLRGGGIADFDDQFNATCELTVWAEYDCSKDLPTDCYGCELYPSRLRGGGKNGKKGKKDEEEEKPNAMKSPTEECKSVMDQFNEILHAYKNALGPCGEASCPFSQNICEKYCKTICLKTRGDPCPCVETDSCIEIPCNIDECPFKEKTDKKFAGGCGSPKCPYAQYKLGLVTDDAELELAFLPPPILGKCGDPKCDYPPQFLSLPPIHWDCPDPLPQGACRNPNCPHQPKELQELKVPTPKAPCGSSLCPYAMPPPCDLPSCPFREKPCPFKSQKQSGAANPTCSSEESDDDGDCCNPDCPYSSKGKGKGKGKGKSSSPPSGGCCSNPGCPPPGCPPPGCPPRGCCPSPGCPPPGCCPPPRCPLPGCPPPGCPAPGCCTPPRCPSPGCPPPGCPPPGCPPPRCPSPGCPPPGCPTTKMKKPGCCCNQDSDTEESFCDSPECPLNRRKGDPPTCLPKKSPNKSETCPNPECPSRVYARHKKGSDDALICDNNDCPYRKGQGNRDDDEVCGNPKCPYNEPPKQKSICANPKCPFASNPADGDDTDNASICSSPDCPFGQLRKKKQKGSASVCGNPNCPFKEKPADKNFDVCDECQDGVCKNPDCPNSKPPPRSSGPDYCDNAMCPFSKEYQTSVCVDPFCPYAQPLPSCGIPNCPYEKKPIMFCPSPICPSKFLGAATNQGNKENRRESGDKKPSTTGVDKEAKKSQRRRSSEERKKNVDGGGDTPAEKPTTPTAKSRATNTKDRKRESPYVYEIGDKWPGVKIGHKECNPPRFRIPQKMGWMWKLQQPYYSCKLQRGWRPGCVEKTVAAIISAFRESKGLGLLKIPDFGTGGKKKRGATDSDDDSLHMKPKPTLHITKKDGVYNILMNPLKDPFSLAENEDPYMDCTPMQFKITKNKLKGGDGDLCMCGGDGDDDSDDSELDIEFTPPAGIIHPDRFKKKKNVIHVESQYNPADFEQKKAKAKSKKDTPKGKGKEKGQGKGKKNKKMSKGKYKDPGFC